MSTFGDESKMFSRSCPEIPTQQMDIIEHYNYKKRY